MTKVLVGMSGGVDSSVAALLLKEQGHEVIGATMSIWGKDGIFKKIKDKAETNGKKFSSHGACLGPNEKEDIESAKEICKILDIPFYVFNCASQYEEIVLKNFKKEYLNGRTPNPCVWCNALIKFELLPNLAKMNGIKFDKFATGHYACVEKSEDGRYLLKRGINHKKDQSYFLYRLNQTQLQNILLPLGKYTKSEIREIAQKHNLPVAEKVDSQDFYEGDYNELLEVEDKEGNIINKNGQILGKHYGIWNYTVGQRKGLGISADEPLYVIELKKDTNEVIVGKKDSTMKNELIAVNLNWISVEKLNNEMLCEAKFRSSQELQSVKIIPLSNDSVKVKFENAQFSISPGQSIVFYKNDTVIGGGIIDVVL